MILLNDVNPAFEENELFSQEPGFFYQTAGKPAKAQECWSGFPGGFSSALSDAPLRETILPPT